MKKFLLSLTAIILSFAMLILSGCADSSPLSFNNDFAGGGGASEINTDYTEVLKYDVERIDSYASIKRTEGIKDQLIPTYSGTYTMTFNGNPDTTGIEKGVQYDAKIFYLKSELKLDLTVDGKTFNDHVISEVYFYESGQSLAPIYSRSLVKNTFIYLSNGKVTTVQAVFEYTTSYGNGSYYQVKKQYAPDKDEDVNLVNLDTIRVALDTATENRTEDQTALINKLTPLNGGSNSYEYKVKRLIDNNQLLFAIRNTGLASGSSTTVPTVSPVYGDAKDLTVKNANDSTLILNGGLVYNNNKIIDAPTETTPSPTDITIPVKNVSFVIGGTDNVGTAQYVVLQKNSNDDALTNKNTITDSRDSYERSLPLVYVETLIEYGGFNHLGALKYTLKEVTITKL